LTHEAHDMPSTPTESSMGSGAVMCPVASAADRSDSVDADDHAHTRIVAKLQADLAPVHELGEETALPLGKAHPVATISGPHGRHVISVAVDGETTPQLMHRDVGAGLDESPQLRLGAARARGRAISAAVVVSHVSVFPRDAA
jgi:hypothetical protein